MMAELEKVVSGHQCRRTKFEMEKALYHKFDVRKRERTAGIGTEKRDWMVGLDQFLDHLSMRTH